MTVKVKVDIDSASYCSMVLTAGLDVTQVNPDLRVQGKAPGRLHLASGVPTEVVAPPEFGVLLGHVMTVRVLSAPWLAVVTGFSDADCTLVFIPASIVAALVCGGIYKTICDSIWLLLHTIERWPSFCGFQK